MSKVAAIKDVSLLTPGWYAIGFEDENGEINWGGAPICKYLGEGEWSDEEGNPIDVFFDPFLQMNVSTDGADAYFPQ